MEGDIRRVDYLDKNGKITSYPYNLYATIIQFRDIDGNPIKEYYLD